MQDDPSDYCYVAPPEIHSETCFRHPSAQSLLKCPSKECFEPLILTSCRSRLASQISNDSGFKGVSLNKPSSLTRLVTKGIESPNTASNEEISMNNSRIIVENMENSIPSVQINITGADYSNFDGIIVNNIDTHLLYCPMIPQDPYTPESIESHSPYPEPSSYEELESEKELFINKGINVSNEYDNLIGASDSVLSNNDSVFYMKKSQSLDKYDYFPNKVKSVSPRQLKSRLENILKSSESNVGSDISTEVEECSMENDKLSNKNLESLDESFDKISKTSAKINKARKKCKCFDCKLC